MRVQDHRHDISVRLPLKTENKKESAWKMLSCFRDCQTNRFSYDMPDLVFHLSFIKLCTIKAQPMKALAPGVGQWDLSAPVLTNINCYYMNKLGSLSVDVAVAQASHFQSKANGQDIQHTIDFSLMHIDLNSVHWLVNVSSYSTKNTMFCGM